MTPPVSAISAVSAFDVVVSTGLIQPRYTTSYVPEIAAPRPMIRKIKPATIGNQL
jgi:hypothetical protein